MLSFFLQTMGTNHFLEIVEYTKKKTRTQKCTEKKITQKLPSQMTTKFTFAFYRLTKLFSICFM